MFGYRKVIFYVNWFKWNQDFIDLSISQVSCIGFKLDLGRSYFMIIVYDYEWLWYASMICINDTM